MAKDCSSIDIEASKVIAETFHLNGGDRFTASASRLSILGWRGRSSVCGKAG
jgi:hypothetical protein